VSKILAKLAEKEQVGIVLLGKQVSEGENSILSKTVFRIRIQLSPDLDPIRIQGF
jgi:hypothetical protein